LWLSSFEELLKTPTKERRPPVVSESGGWTYQPPKATWGPNFINLTHGFHSFIMIGKCGGLKL